MICKHTYPYVKMQNWKPQLDSWKSVQSLPQIGVLFSAHHQIQNQWELLNSANQKIMKSI